MIWKHKSNEAKVYHWRAVMAAADAFGRVMLELMEHVLSSSSESRSQESIENILPMFRTRTPLFYNLSTGKNFTVRTFSANNTRQWEWEFRYDHLAFSLSSIKGGCSSPVVFTPVRFHYVLNAKIMLQRKTKLRSNLKIYIIFLYLWITMLTSVNVISSQFPSLFIYLFIYFYFTFSLF